MKKTEKRICWNCDGDVSHHFTDCPYCGVDLTRVPSDHASHPRELGDPFQAAPQSATQPRNGLAVSEQDWKQALDATVSSEKEPPIQVKRELVALLLLLPGIVFCLFALLLIFFSDDGVLALQWNQSLAYFYFLGAVPLIFLGWKILRSS
ncbi:MAG: hypothetical protein JSS62_04455 [Verrucomicrobia bacterium]|nr:hypothetical protein [Verrucomicrobiota bacterium]MBS0646297.1 hypothetical protein [Verrucomicrobiota bacterium]